MQRSSGILLHITSLPSPYGIGTLGKAAYAFADFLKKSGQGYWQTLPPGHTGFGDSPYQSFSAFAGNPYFIDLDMLIEDGLLTDTQVKAVCGNCDARRVDYGAVYKNRMPLLREAFKRGWSRYSKEVDEFAKRNGSWLNDYALFMALKAHFGMCAWTQWADEAARAHDTGALAHYSELLADEIHFYSFVQFLFFKQWDELKTYANGLGIKLIGDMPIYVAMDSVDTWAQSENFMLGADRMPAYVAGVPPDFFSATGQLWGNPLYDWNNMRANGYSWWLSRIENAARLFDVIRIDHFRGIESYWRVPAGESTAINGEWIKGPGRDFIDAIKRDFPRQSIIAEDLGCLTEDVRRLLAASGYPGMKVLQFAFDPGGQSDYLPHTYQSGCVCYTGTHDNNTAMGWFDQVDKNESHYAVRYLGLNCEEGYNWGLIRGGMSSAAELFIAQMQDYLGLDAHCRMNTPATMGDNWSWRLMPEECTEKLAQRIYEYTHMYGRCLLA